MAMASTILSSSPSPLSSSPTSNLVPTDPEELLRRCTELSFILHHALRLDPHQGSPGHGLSRTIPAYLDGNSAIEQRLKLEKSVVEEESFLLDISLPVTTSLIGSLEASFAEALDLTSGFRPVNGGELNDESPTTAQDVRDQRVLNSERRSELLGLQKDIVEQQEALQLSLTNLLTLLTKTLQTYPPLLHSHHLTLTIPSFLKELSVILLKFSLLPLRSRDNLSRSHPQLDASLSSLEEALERRIKRAAKESGVLEKELEGYKKAFGGEREAKRFEGLMKELEEIGRERSQVERDIKRLAGGVTRRVV
ncbi:hypothetical protein BDY24DRAFT_385133 [Mrakia frigida]|uniref:uncharacterized protein n=1 Tax=Mrakia frigida TaxID=29902 RepID=UPI003FCBF01B